APCRGARHVLGLPAGPRIFAVVAVAAGPHEALVAGLAIQHIRPDIAGQRVAASAASDVFDVGDDDEARGAAGRQVDGDGGGGREAGIERIDTTSEIGGGALSPRDPGPPAAREAPAMLKRTL